MSNLSHLIRRDLHHITRNVMASIVVFGLVIIPSLFTWFNVIASWDPFANTSSLKVAVASTDSGYQSDLMPLRLNVGEQVLSELRANEDLNWIITSKDDAIEGAKSGKYYASIVLPPSFSTDMMTFYTSNVERTSIGFYTNEKKNALAPKITEQGAEGVSAQINASFAGVLSDVALGLLASVSDYLTDADTQAALTRVETRVGSISDQLRSGAHTADMLTNLVEGSIPLVDSADALVHSAREAFGDSSNSLGGGTSAVKDLNSALDKASGALGSALKESASGYDAVDARIDEIFAQGDQATQAQAGVLDSLADMVNQQVASTTTLRTTIEQETTDLTGPEKEAAIRVLARLDDSIARQEVVRDRLHESATDIRNGNAQAQQSHKSIQTAIAQAKQAITDAQQAYVNDLQPQLDRLSADLEVISSDIQTVRDDLSAMNSGLSDSDNSVHASLTHTADVTSNLSASLTQSADKFVKLQRALSDAATSDDLSALSEAIGSEPSLLATSLAEPVQVNRNSVFPIAGFGAGMTPLYTVLALWVGALLMTVTIRVDVDHETLPDRAKFTPTQKYFGRFGVFALVGLAQSTLVTLGLILFVQIEPAHPMLMVFAGWIISLVFTLIIYTFVVAFGNAGKAIAVLLLVIQISGSGGAYPLQLLPPWFQSISPFLPATYAIDALRAAIAGVYRGDFWIAIGLLLLFVLPALLLGLVLRRPLISYNRGLINALESTKLM